MMRGTKESTPPTPCGGGLGIREAYNDASLVNSFRIVQGEAKSAFGRSDVYIEKLMEQARHIEFQILADNFGNVIHLGERDCSLQRRNQKLIEEAPSSILDPKTREEVGKSVVKAVKSIKYSNAGTVEFLLMPAGQFYFMEMNTRIQVEHTITEAITGLDLIREQILIAAGEKLEYRQGDIKLSGHAIECRINAEDPERNFMPSPGTITELHAPGGQGVRVDSHIYTGYKIPPFYDSLLAKLITHGATRDEAILRMKRALSEFTIGGVKTTIPFHRRVMEDERFRQGEVYVDFLNSFNMAE